MPAAPVRFKLKWADAQDLRTTFVDQLSVVKSGATVYLTFGEVSPPPVVTPDMETTDLVIRPVARLAVPDGAFGAFARVIAGVMDSDTDEEHEPNGVGNPD